VLKSVLSPVKRGDDAGTAEESMVADIDLRPDRVRQLVAAPRAEGGRDKDDREDWLANRLPRRCRSDH
jgi:hypothetical protein